MTQRPIKFRAWDKENKIMLSSDCDLISEMPIRELRITKFLAFMQFTGLKDKNGKEIYEGDIVKDEYGDNTEVKIEKFSGGGMESTVNGFGFALNDTDIETLEVIGNIYENKDLLK